MSPETSAPSRSLLQRMLDLLLTNEPRQRMSLVTTGLACLLMVFCILAMKLVAAAGLADEELVHWWALASGACVFASFALIRSGFTRHWHDPAFTHIQITYAITSNAAAYVIAGHARGIVPPILAVIMMFGVFGLGPAQIKALLAYGLVAFCIAGAVVQWWGPPDATTPGALAAVYLLIVVMVLVTSTALTLRAHAVRERLQAKKRELSRAVEQIRDLATRDELTGLPNRRYMLEVMRIEGLRAGRSGQPLLMAQLDLDFFKAVNDTYGHGAGDQVLQCFARTVLACVRNTDILARWGGEEFVLLMADTSAEDGQRLLERVRATVADTPVQLAPGVIINLTISIGAAQLNRDETPLRLLQRTDEALYSAKRQGRNSVVWAE